MPEVQTTSNTSGDASIHALTAALAADEQPSQSAGEPKGAKPPAEPGAALEEASDANAEPQEGDEPEVEAEAQAEPDEAEAEGELIELPLKDRDGNPIKATADELREWRENGLRQQDYSRSMNELREATERERTQYRTQVEQTTQQFTEQLQLLQAAVAATVAPELKNIDWQLLAAQSPQDYVRLKARAEQVQSVMGQIQGLHEQHVAKRNAEMQQAQKQAAQEAVSELSKSIPNWNDETYSHLMQYAVKQGFSEEEVLSSTDAKAFKILWKAAQYDQLQKAKPGVQAKLNQLPKVMKPGTQHSKVTGQAMRFKEVAQRHQKDKSVRSLANLLNAIE